MALGSQKAPRPRFLRTLSVETLVFFGLLASIVLAGFNSGNNLLYLIAGAMLGSIFVSLIAGRINLSRLRVRRRLPRYVFAGHPFRLGLEISNDKKFFDSFGINLDGAAGDHSHLFFVSVEKRGKQAHEAGSSLERRGLQKFPSMTLSSKFPWGMFDLRKQVADQQEVIVYPHIYDVSNVIAGSGHIRDEFPQHLKGPGGGLYGVREYRHGEDAASICWKLSAKLDRLMVRETECEERRRVCVVFDNALKNRSKVALEAFEKAVSASASLLWYLSRNGYSLKLVTRDKVIGYGEGLDQMHRMLIALALVEPAAPDGAWIPTDKNMFEGGAGVLVTCDAATTAIRSTDGDFSLVISEGIRQDNP